MTQLARISPRVKELLKVANAVDYNMQLDLRRMRPGGQNPTQRETVEAAVKAAAANGVMTGKAGDMVNAPADELELFVELLVFLMDSGIFSDKTQTK